MSNRLIKLNELKSKLSQGGGNDEINRQHAKGKMTARERIKKLFDTGTFVETGLFIKNKYTNFAIENNKIETEAVVTGYGQVNGRLIYIIAQDYTISNGAFSEMHAEKIARCQEMAMKVGAPIIYMYDSKGVKINEGIDALSGYGKVVLNNTLASGLIPQISMIMGLCAGGAAFSPAISDFIFMVNNTSHMFLTGPQAIYSTNDYDETAETLGGSVVHNSKSGVSHFFANDENECIEQVKKLISYLPQNNLEKAESLECLDDLNRLSLELNEIISENSDQVYDMKGIINSIADNNDFFEIQPEYAKNILIGFIRLAGKSIGVVANQPMISNGNIDINASDKASRFIRTCDCFNIPILTLVDTQGYSKGIEQEQSGLIRHGAKLLYAYSEATIPMVTVIVRKAFGSAYICMGSKNIGADIVYAWPDAEIGIMNAECAVNIVYANEIKSADNPSAEREKRIDEYKNSILHPCTVASRGYIDDIIEPAMTRKMLIAAFDSLESKFVKKVSKKHGNIPL